MNEIDSICMELIEYLNTCDSDPESLIVRAINVATIQFDYAKYEVGVADKKFRMLKKMMVVDSEFESTKEVLINKKRYAKRLSLCLDRLVEMYQAGEIK